jgi:hypothetical protein
MAALLRRISLLVVPLLAGYDLTGVTRALVATAIANVAAMSSVTS